jgi:hypothetical protein
MKFWNKTIKYPKNFIFGYGSIINEKSRNCTCGSSFNAIPVRISTKFGYRRCWNFHSPTAKITALGLEKTNKENASTINGILYPLDEGSMKKFDEREEGYKRIKIPLKYIQKIGWECLPKHNCNIWTYVPNNNFLLDASLKNPILQSYIDVCINGTLKYGEQFTIEFLETTFNWSYWLNDRQIPRRPWIHEKNYKVIDEILSKYPSKKIDNNYKNRKLPTEYISYHKKNTK